MEKAAVMLEMMRFTCIIHANSTLERVRKSTCNYALIRSQNKRKTILILYMILVNNAKENRSLEH